MTGKVIHFEIPFDDGPRARSFYAAAFGWQVQELPDMDYTMAETGPTEAEKGPTEPGYINGGMFQRGWGSLETPVITIDVDDIDSALAAVEREGGSVVKGRDEVPGMGFTAYIKDSEGNTIGLWQNAPTSD